MSYKVGNIVLVWCQPDYDEIRDTDHDIKDIKIPVEIAKIKDNNAIIIVPENVRIHWIISKYKECDDKYLEKRGWTIPYKNIIGLYKKEKCRACLKQLLFF